MDEVRSNYTIHYTNPTFNLLRTTNNNRTQEMSAFALSMRMRSTNRTPPRTPINKCCPRWQRGGQGFDPPRLHPLCAKTTARLPTHVSDRSTNLPCPLESDLGSDRGHTGGPPTRHSRASGYPRAPDACSLVKQFALWPER